MESSSSLVGTPARDRVTEAERRGVAVLLDQYPTLARDACLQVVRGLAEDHAPAPRTRLEGRILAAYRSVEDEADARRVVADLRALLAARSRADAPDPIQAAAIWLLGQRPDETLEACVRLVEGIAVHLVQSA